MKTYSQCLSRSMLDTAEALYRAQNNDFCLGRMDADLDAVRAVYPTKRYCTYAMHHRATAETAAAWIAFAGGTTTTGPAAGGFIHHAAAGGAARQRPDGYYVMNMSHAPYLNWRRQRTINAMLGTEFDATPHATGPMNVVDYDLARAYAAFDDGSDPAGSYTLALASDPNNRVGDSVEYSGDAQGYDDDCVADFIATKALVNSTLGADYEVMPNLGDISFALAVDANTTAMIAGCEVLCVETTLRYDGGKLEVPNATDALTRWSFIDTHCGTNGKDLIAQGWLDAPDTQEAKDQATIGTSAFFLLADQPRLYGRFISDLSEPAVHISNWEHNELIRAATTKLGSASGSRTEVGSYTQVRLFYRDFVGGRVYLCLQKAGQTGNETATHTLPSMMYPLDADGNYGAAVTSVSLACGDAAILWNGVIMGLTIVATPGASNANSYLTLAEADTYFFADPAFETWDRLDTIAKYRHMIRATRELDAEMGGNIKFNQKLTAGVPEQALIVPRSVDVENGTTFIPVAVKQACFEQIAANIQGSGAGFRQDLRAAGVVEIELGDGTREKYADGSGSGSGSVLTTKARDILLGGNFIIVAMGYSH